MARGMTPDFSGHLELGTQLSTHYHVKKAASLLQVLSSQGSHQCQIALQNAWYLVTLGKWKVELLL